MSFTKSEARGTLVDGTSVKLYASLYFSMLVGSGLKWSFIDQSNNTSELYERMLHGDGKEPVGLIEVSNDTGGNVDYVFYTSSVRFDPISIGASQNVSIVGQVGTLSMEGAEAAGAAATANPVQVGGVDDAGDVQAVRLDVDGRTIVAPFGAADDQVNGETPFSATGVATVLAAPGAALRLHVAEITVTNRDTVLTTVLIYSGATLKRRITVPIGDTRSVAFPAGLVLGVNEALRADIVGAITTNPVYVAATAAVGV